MKEYIKKVLHLFAFLFLGMTIYLMASCQNISNQIMQNVATTASENDEVDNIETTEAETEKETETEIREVHEVVGS